MSFESVDLYLNDINSAKSLDDILLILQKQISRFGFDKFTYWLRWPSSGKQKPIYISTYPDKFVDHYIRSDFQSHDMVGRFSLHTNLPFEWSSIGDKFSIRWIKSTQEQ